VTEVTRFVGLDVHATETQAAVLDQKTGEMVYRRIRGRPREVVDYLETVARPFRAVYEAGPTGYGLARRAAERGLSVEVCAPGHILKHASERIKTDRRDAARLARLLLAGELRLVRVPAPEEERLRDVVRAREDIRVDLMRARHRLSKLLLRRELYYPGPGSAWTRRHREWLDRLRFCDRASEVVFTDYLEAQDLLLTRRDRLERELIELAADSPWTTQIANLRALRGIDTLSATGLCAEIADFDRFTPEQLASYLGLVPCEDSSGPERRQGQITKAGSKHARRLLVEAAWHYRHSPHISEKLRRRQRDCDPRAVQIAWRAQRRLHGRWRQLAGRRGKRETKVAVAVARELSGFCWEVALLG
jgi:transposase